MENLPPVAAEVAPDGGGTMPPVVAAPPAVPATPIPATPIPATPPAPQFDVGGQAGNGNGNAVSRWFENVSFTEVGMLILGSTALFLVIAYYRKKIKYIREEESTVSNQIDEIKANVQSFIGPAYKSFS